MNAVETDPDPIPKRFVKVIKKGQKTSRQINDENAFKNDILRKKYDLRYQDPKSINNIFLRGRIVKLKTITDEANEKNKKTD